MKLDMSLPELLNEAETIPRDVQSTFGQLTAEQLNWKPKADSWSVAQCLEHLMAANGKMMEAFDPVINGTKQTSFVERLPILPGLWGRLIVKTQAPGNSQKFKAPPDARPSVSAIDPQIVSQFVAHQGEVINRMVAIENLNPAEVIVTSPFAGFVTYSLLNACRLLVVHERRHLAQAERVMATSGFPQ